MQCVLKYFFTKQFLRFLLVGGTAAFAQWLLRIVLSIWMNFSSAVLISYAFGMFIAFVLSSIFVFPRSHKPRVKQARDFIVTNLCVFPIVWIAAVAINILLKNFGIISFRETIAHGVALSLPMFATFLMYKFFAFKDI